VLNLPRGTRDFTPEEMEKRRHVQKTMTSTFKSFGYEEIQTPTFENLELFTAKSGVTIINELYSFKDKGNRELALRPELTAPAIRFYVEKLQMEPKPLKLFYFGNCFRYDRPQKGRYREFWQFGCELIGTSTSEALAELIALAYHSLKKTGLLNIKLHIGHLSLLDQKVDETLGLKKPPLSEFHPGGQVWKNEMFRLIDKEDLGGVINKFKAAGATEERITMFTDVLNYSSLDELKKIGFKQELEQELERFEKIIMLLSEFGVVKDNSIKMGIARGLDYYKGIVFEIDAPVLGSEKQLCGGGEYNLVKLFGGKDTPTAGFAIGFDRTLLALEIEKYEFPVTKIQVYIIPVKEETIKESIKIAQNLRKVGILTDIDLLRRGIGKSLKYANAKSAKYAIILGPDELEKDSVTLRNMKTGDQELLKIKDIISRLKKIL